jgi:hypothetical protein
MEMSVEKIEVMRISRQSLSAQIMLYKKKTGECKIFQVFRSTIANDGRYAREIKSMIIT